MGAHFRQAFIRCDHATFRTWVSHHQGRVTGACPSASLEYHAAHYPPGTILMIGDERQGLSPRQRDCCDQLVRIPMQATTDSLNLAVASSVLLYEVWRSPEPQSPPSESMKLQPT
ncbi:MAG: hypothetical protein O7G85_11595 [Planctomycetota bacterium]|nr:hypothetical protein [Planctomycetota bacterium]